MTMALVVGTDLGEELNLYDGITNGSDFIDGLGGDDWIYALFGDDFVFGGDGADHLFGSNGGDLLNGGDGNDWAHYDTGYPGPVTVNLETGLGFGGEAEGDILVDIENVVGTRDNDILFGDAGANELDGGDGNDTLKGGGGADTLLGSWGDDTLTGGAGADALDGGSDGDTAAYDESPLGVAVSLSAGAASGGDAAGDTLEAIENLTGSAHADWLDGDDGANVLNGLAGDDTLRGFGGADTLYGGDDDDTLKGGGGADVLDGGDGIDTARYVDSNDEVSVSLMDGTGWAGDAGGDILVGIENLTGSNHDDDLEGDDGANVLNGLAGDDELEGRGGADILNGGGGSDTAVYLDSPDGVLVSLRSDTAAGGDAAGDELNGIENLAGSTHGDVLSGDDNANVLTGAGGNDLLRGFGGADVLLGGNDAESLYGMDGADALKGFGGADLLDGGTGADTMLGGEGDDIYIVDDFGDVATETIGEGFDRVKTSASYSLAAGSEVEVLYIDSAAATAIDLTGNEFDNTIVGNAGINVIVGGLGRDTVTGGGGGDAFLWSSVDEIGLSSPDIVADYSSAQGDVLHFTNVDADETVAGNQDFTFIGAAAFTAAGQINWFSNGTDTFIQLNTNADLAADAIVQLNGVPTGDSVWMFL
jgi:Ca2+-binding RTX toxin-like protein